MHFTRICRRQVTCIMTYYAAKTNEQNSYWFQFRPDMLKLFSQMLHFANPQHKKPLNADLPVSLCPLDVTAAKQRNGSAQKDHQYTIFDDTTQYAEQ